MSKYISEVKIRTGGYLPKNARTPLVNPEYFGICRGYWGVGLKKDSLGNDQTDGIVATLEYFANDFEEAEDTALSATKKLATFLAAYTGSPLEQPQLGRIALVGSLGGVVEQRDYYYDESEARPLIKMVPDDLTALIRRAACKSSKEQTALETAIRWYGIATAAEEPPDAYLALWIGLEALGSDLNNRFHPNGEKAPCHTCKNIPGKKRKRAEAGIEHLIRRVAPQCLEHRSLQELKNIRNKIVHAGIPLTSVVETATELVHILLKSLAIAILEVAQHEWEDQTLRLSEPKDHETRPSSMYQTCFRSESPYHKPWYGDWVPIERTWTLDSSEIRSSGMYERFTRNSFEKHLLTDHPSTEPSFKFTIFPRKGIEYKEAEGGGEIQLREWRKGITSP